MKISRRVRHGSIVRKRGDKWILVGKGYKGPIGAYSGHPKEWLIYTDDSDTPKYACVPAGVFIKGEVEVLVAPAPDAPKRRKAVRAVIDRPWVDE